MVLNRVYDAAEFLSAHTYENVNRWAKAIDKRSAVKRGVLVNKSWGETQLHERHDANDFENKAS